MQYCFQFGRQPSFSLLELYSVFEVLGCSYSVDFVFQGGCIVTFYSTIDPHLLQQRLGGTIRIARVYSTVPPFSFSSHDISSLWNQLDSSSIRSFGVGSLTAVTARRYRDRIEQFLRSVGMDIKRHLRDHDDGHPLRIVFPKRRQLVLSGGSFFSHHLNDNGAEVLFVFTGDLMYVALTEAHQDIEWYSKRDIGRPARDMRVGMMPIKLSQMLLNIAMVPGGGRILDPFCGLGTLIQEGVLMGYEMIGSDLSSEMVTATNNNMQWLSSHFSSSHKLPGAYSCFQSDARVIVRHVSGSVDAIVTEGYLGPLFSSSPTLLDIEHAFADLSVLYKKAFQQFFTLLCPGGRVIITFPSYFSHKQQLFLPILDEVCSLGYSLDTRIDALQRDGFDVTTRNTLLYSRPDHIVSRECVVFIKNK